jgi:hypothetical protein
MSNLLDTCVPAACHVYDGSGINQISNYICTMHVRSVSVCRTKFGNARRDGLNKQNLKTHLVQLSEMSFPGASDATMSSPQPNTVEAMFHQIMHAVHKSVSRVTVVGPIFLTFT